MNPTYPYDKLNGSWVKNGAASQVNPPGALLKELNDTKNMNFNAHLKLNYDMTNSLSVSAFGAYSYASNENNQFCPTWFGRRAISIVGSSRARTGLPMYRLTISIRGESSI